MTIFVFDYRQIVCDSNTCWTALCIGFLRGRILLHFALCSILFVTTPKCLSYEDGLKKLVFFWQLVKNQLLHLFFASMLGVKNQDFMQIRLLQPTIQLDVVGSLNRIDLQRPIGTCKRPILGLQGIQECTLNSLLFRVVANLTKFEMTFQCFIPGEPRSEMELLNSPITTQLGG